MSKALTSAARHRVKTYGEVFTPPHMVDRMLDLVTEELEIGSDFVNTTFLEPSAGQGIFLVAILRRKLRAVENRYTVEEWPEASLFSLASIYGIELLEDNHHAAKDALLREFVSFHEGHNVPCGTDTRLHQAAAFLIETNVVRGNTLTGRDWQDKQIQFSWWNRVRGIPGMVHREPFTLASLRDGNAFDFTTYESYEPCRIDAVHEGENAGA